MKRPKTVMTAVAVLALMIAATPVVAGALDGTSREPGAAAAGKEVQPEVVRVDKWLLLQSSGAELYGELCASCHGAEGKGNGPAARSLAVYPPPLDHLEKDGVAESHWTYVVLAPCEDVHHWGPDGTKTMPCWQRIFRQALGGTDAGPMLVSAKLETYLKGIQE